MMLGDLDRAIETYTEAVRRGTEASTTYGLAVALDRNDEGDRARAIIEALGPDAYREFRKGIALHETFFVPDGEVYYYLALADEVFSADDDAIDEWNRFVRSGAHPAFQPRARAHLDALLAKRRKHLVSLPAQHLIDL